MAILDLLYDFQKNIVNNNKDRDSFGLYLDMGLGKTPISLGFLEANNCDKAIIITLNTKVEETEEERGSWKYWIKQMSIPYEICSKKTLSFDPSKPQLLLVNYEALASREKDRKVQAELKDNILDFIKSCKGHRVGIILDECHKIKNLSSIQTKVIMKMKTKLEHYSKVYTYLLSGTPFTDGYIDLYSQLKILGCPMNKNEFCENFCKRGRIPGLLEWQQPIVGYKNLDKLYDLIHQYAITIKSNEVIELPEKLFVNHICNQSSCFEMLTTEHVRTSQLLEYSNRKEFKNLYLEKGDVKVNNPFYRNLAYPDVLKWLASTTGVFWLRARQASIGFQGNEEDYEWFDRTRLDKFEEFLKNNEDNYVLFCNYTPELFEIYNICEKLGYNIDVYVGEIKSQLFYDKYCSQTEEERLTNKKNVLIANFTSGGTGKNWQEYNKCIMFSLPIYKDYEQGIKRIHRIGQKNTVVYHIFYQDNWLDKGMLESLEQKINYSEDLFENNLKNFN